jgi:aryl-alcohol dehydrogenase-like predicted oxidoreductase
MAQLVTEGKVRHLGVSEVTPAQLDQAAAVHPISAVQFEWSLLWRDPEDDIVPAARLAGAGIVTYSPLGRGMLTATLTRDDIDGSDFRRGDPRFQGGDLDNNLTQVAALRRVADDLGITPAQLALAWLLARGPDVVPIPGSRHLDRIEQNAAAADVVLNEADLRSLDDAVPRASWAGDRRSFAAAATSRRAAPVPGQG